MDWERGILATIQPILTRHQAGVSDADILHIFHELERDQQAKTPDFIYSDLLAT